MKKISISIIIILLAVIGLTACSPKEPTKEITLPELQLKYSLDNSLPLLTGDNSEELLGNIDRGFRLETYYTLGSGNSWPTDNESGYDMLNNELSYYADDKCNEIQVYIYLNEYNNKPLDTIALNQLKAYFEYIRELRMSMLLRFSYDYEQQNWISPTQTVMLNHLAQLKQFMSDNVDLINDTVTAYQFGVIGAWGEWGATGQKYNEKKVLNALVDMLPDGTYFQGRYMRVTNQLRKNSKYDKVGYHNDFLIGRPHPWNTAGDRYWKEDYKTFIERNMYTINDGELPWGGATEEPNEYVDGKNFIKQMMEHRMTTLSIKHNYKEFRNRKNEFYNIERWKSDYITPQQLDEMNCPYYDAYFKDKDGNAIQRTVYEYLRDFLGYQLAVSDYKLSENGKQISFMITNFGMAAPLTLDGFAVAISNGTDIEYKNLDIDTKQLITYGQVKITLDLNESVKGSQVGLRIHRNNSQGNYYIKTANNLLFNNGVNWFN